MVKLIFAILMAIMPTVHAYEFPLVMLKAGGDFSANNYVTENADECSRIVNFKNVSLIRKLEDRGILVDGHINIVFKTKEKREQFLSEYVKFIEEKPKKRWWEIW